VSQLALSYVIWFPIGCVALTVGIGLGMEWSGLVRNWYASPFVLAVTIAALNTGRSGGYLAACLSTLVFNFVFVRPMGFSVPTPDEAVAYVTMFAAAYVAGRNRIPPESAAERYTGALPFVRKKKSEDRSESCWWDVLPTGRWIDDTMVGHEYGRIYISTLIRTSTPPLSWVVRDMVKNGKYTGIEAGFCGAIRNALVGKDPLTPNNHALNGNAERPVVGADGGVDGSGTMRHQ
jgi:hypothetical protein